MNILVTGGCGFIGSHIVDAYIKMGHRVSVIDDLTTGSINNLNKQAVFYHNDITSPDLTDILNNENFDIINHHAAQINVRTSVDDPILDARVNILGALNILQYGIQHGMKRIIFASSGGAVYGEPTSFPITEEFPIAPASPYGIAKATFEKYLTVFAHLYDYDHVILRYTNVYGPRQISKSEAGVISIFIENILNKNKCTIFGDGNQTRDYVYVADVVAANVNALACDTQTVNIGTGIETSVNDLITILSTITREKIEYEYAPAKAGDVLRNVVNTQKAARYLNWEPKVVLKDGIEWTFDYFQKQNVRS